MVGSGVCCRHYFITRVAYKAQEATRPSPHARIPVRVIFMALAGILGLLRLLNRCAIVKSGSAAGEQLTRPSHELERRLLADPSGDYERLASVNCFQLNTPSIQVIRIAWIANHNAAFD